MTFLVSTILLLAKVNEATEQGVNATYKQGLITIQCSDSLFLRAGKSAVFSADMI